MVIADEESKYLWDFFDKSKLEGVDLIISCGDLNPNYLSFLTTFAAAPVLYVHGNHDEKYDRTPPEGCICIDDGRDLPHQGFQVFIELIEKYSPKFFVHGHVHMTYGRQHKRCDKYKSTHIINAYERYVFDYEDDEMSPLKFGKIVGQQ